MSDVPESVVLLAQREICKVKDAVRTAEAEVERAEKRLCEARVDLDLDRDRLRELADFLAEQCPGDTDWYAEAGIKEADDVE